MMKMERKDNRFLLGLVGFYIFCVLLFDDSPTLYVFSNAVFAVVLFAAIMQKNFTVQRSGFSMAAALLLAWTALSLIWCADANAVKIDIQKQVSFILLMFAVSHLCGGVRDYTSIFQWFLIAGVGYFIMLMAEYGIQSFLAAILSGNRIGGSFLQLNKLAVNCALIIIIAFNLLLETRKKVYLIPMLMMLFLMIGAESRRSFLVLVISIAFSFIVFMKNQGTSIKKFQYLIIGLCVCAIAFYTYKNSALFSGLNSRFLELGDSSNQETLRMLYLTYGFRSFLEHPLLGLGSGNSHIVTLMAAGKRTYLHNNYIEMLVNLGIIGFLIYYYLYYYLIKRLYSAGVSNLETRVMLSLLLAQLVSDFGVTSYSSKFTYLIFALALAVIRKNVRSKRESLEAQSREKG